MNAEDDEFRNNLWLTGYVAGCRREPFDAFCARVQTLIGRTMSSLERGAVRIGYDEGRADAAAPEPVAC